MRASIFLLENDGNNWPICITLVCERQYTSIEELRTAAQQAKRERYEYRPGILCACVNGEQIVNLV